MLVTELMELGDLQQWSQSNREFIQLDVIMRLMLDVTEGLADLHREMILHRDIKPSNILLQYDEENTVRAKLAGMIWDSQVKLCKEGFTHVFLFFRF